MPITLNGRVQYTTFGYPDQGTLGQRLDNFLEAQLRGNGELSPTLNYQFEGRAVADDADFTAGGYSLRNANRRRAYLSLITARLNHRPFEGLRVSVGKQIVNWSVFDGIEPANLLSTVDQSDPFREVRLGLPSLVAHYQPGPAYAELIVVPLAFTATRTPQGRWAIIPPDVTQRQELPPTRVDETQAGMRLGTHVGTLEGSVFGYVGRDYFPMFIPQLVYLGFGDYRLDIITTYPRLRAGGLNASEQLSERLLVRLESVYFNSPDRNRDDFLHTVGGVEYSVGDWRLILNYFRDDETVRAHDEVTNKGGRRFFRSFLFGEAGYDAGGDFHARVHGGYDLREEFLFLEIEVSRRLWRQLHLALLGTFIDADRPSYFDTIRQEDRIGTRLEYDF